MMVWASPGTECGSPSPAATDWYDAGYQGDFILEDEESIVFQITSIITGAVTDVEMDLSSFPRRPAKATRIQVDIGYRNEYECEITVTDKGFGDFFPDRGTEVTRTLNLEGYI